MTSAEGGPSFAEDHQDDAIMRELVGEVDEEPGEREGGLSVAQVEGHPWEGRVRRGVFGAGDELGGALSSTQIAQLERLLNGG